MVISVPTGQFFAGGQARGQLARGQLDVQQGQLGVQQNTLELNQQKQEDAQQKQQDAIAKNLVDNFRADIKRIEDGLSAKGGVLDPANLAKVQSLSPEKRAAVIEGISQSIAKITGSLKEQGQILSQQGIDLGADLDRLNRLENIVISGLSSIEQAGITGQEQATTAVAEQKAIAGSDLTPGQQAAAGGAAVQQINTSALSSALKIKRATGEDVDPAVFGADVAKTVNALSQQEALQASVQAQATGTVEDFFEGQQRQEVREFRELETASRNVLSTTARVREIMSQTDFVSGLAGTVIQTIQSVEGTTRQAARSLGVEIEGDPFDTTKYDLSGFGAIAAQSQAFRTNVIGLALQMAAAAEKGGGKLSDDDVKRQLNRLAANSGDPRQIAVALDEIDRGTIANLKNTAKSLRLTPEQQPQDLFAKFDAAGGGFTIEDQTRLDELRAKRGQ